VYSPEFIRFIVLVSLVNLACWTALKVIGLWAIVTVALRPPWRVARDAALDASLWIALLLFILAVNYDYIQSVAIRTLPYRLEVSLFFSLFIIGRSLRSAVGTDAAIDAAVAAHELYVSSNLRARCSHWGSTRTMELDPAIPSGRPRCVRQRGAAAAR
jgi:hypothetical protein